MKTTWMDSMWAKNLGVLLARLAVGAIFIYHGWSKLSDISQFQGLLESFNFPAIAFFSYLIAIAELLGGIGVLLGILTRLAALGLAIIMLGALLIVHIGGGEFNPMAQNTLALFGACCGLVASGGGHWKTWAKNCPMS